MMKKALKVILALALAFGIYVVAVLAWGTIDDWNPKDTIALKTINPQESIADSTFTFLTWNIGFTGLGAETAFFYDGGDVVTQTEELVKKNRDGVKHFLRAKEQFDFFLIQEIDSSAKRSHYVNHLEEFGDVLPNHSYSFAMNYNVDFVPMPVTDPMGSVRSGLASFSRHKVAHVERHAFHSQFDWPTRVFFLDRCFLSQHVPLKNGKELIVLNTHCSAYDTAGTMVANEIQAMCDYALKEYNKGNYIVAGGDWNQCPPRYEPIDTTGAYNEFILDDSQLPNEWHWIADVEIPTNRKIDKPYSRETSYKSVIDHYFISPNLTVERINVADLNFQFSDHQPVILKVRIAD